jgi:hypothetical protein
LPQPPMSSSIAFMRGRRQKAKSPRSRLGCVQ